MYATNRNEPLQFTPFPHPIPPTGYLDELFIRGTVAIYPIRPHDVSMLSGKQGYVLGEMGGGGGGGGLYCPYILLHVYYLGTLVVGVG